jgi:hypothetical protein
MSPPTTSAAPRPSLSVEEVRLISDLRIMHAKVDELHNFVNGLKRRHCEAEVQKYSDTGFLAEDIRKVDELYLWFVKLKEEHDRPYSSLNNA